MAMMRMRNQSWSSPEERQRQKGCQLSINQTNKKNKNEKGKHNRKGEETQVEALWLSWDCENQTRERMKDEERRKHAAHSNRESKKSRMQERNFNDQAQKREWIDSPLLSVLTDINAIISRARVK